MSVYTPLSLAQVQAFALPYGLNIIDLIPIQGGIENTNYFLIDQSQQQYVLTVFEQLDEQGANELPAVLQHLGTHGVSVPVPLTYNGTFIHTLLNKPSQIAPRLMGSHPISPTLEQIYTIAQAQAKLHDALGDFELHRQAYRDHLYWTAVAQQLTPHMNAVDQALLQRVYTVFEQKRAQHPDRPQGWIHSDLFRDNTLFEGNELKGILDFSEVNQDDLIFDLAIAINDFCTEHPDVVLNQEKLEAFLTGYQSVRLLTQDELACLNVYLAMAACRFWLLRLQVKLRNHHETRQSDDILEKNPDEMRALLENRLAMLG